MTEYSRSLELRKFLMKTTNFTLTRLAKLKSLKYHVGKGVESQEYLGFAGEHVNWYNFFEKQFDINQ